MLMEPMPYMLTLHYIVLTMRDVSYPVTKKELMEKYGETPIPTGPDTTVPFKEILAKLPMDTYSCASEFYCNYSAS